jgi:hypothetical protein
LSDPSKRSRKFGSMGVIGYAVLVAFIAGQIVLSMRGRSGSSGSFLGPVPLWVAITVPLLVGIWGSVSLFMVLRDGRVRRRSPDATVYPAVRFPALAMAAELVPAERILGIARHFPTQFSLVVHGDGSLDFWRAIPEFRSFLRVESTEIRGCHVDVTLGRGRTTRCIVISASMLGTSVELPIVVVGSGLFGSFPPNRAALDLLANKIFVGTDS